MRFGWIAAGLGFAAALAVGGAAQAADVQVSVRVGEPSWPRPVADYDDGEDDRFVPEAHQYRAYPGAGPDRFDERPFERPRWRPPVYARPVFGRPGWEAPEECRLIIKRRVNPWGEVVVRRIKICE
jgi:hypothetical protein